MLKQQTLTKQQGFSLIELLVAVAILSIIMSAVAVLYINSSRAYNEDEKYARMQENGRFALNQIASDLQMTGFWGEMLAPEYITSGVTFGTDCNIGLGDTENATRYYNSSGTSSFDPTTACSTLAGTNALAIKRVNNGPSAVTIDGLIYLRTNGFEGSFVDDANTTPPPTGYSDWLYVPVLYFIKVDAGVPYLCRAATNGASSLGAIGSAGDDCLATGIEQIHVEFGLDTDNDGIANRYQSDVLDADTATAVTARVYLLVRSTVEATGNDLADKTYKLGNLADIDKTDGFYRRVYSTTVALRNPMNALGF